MLIIRKDSDEIQNSAPIYLHGKTFGLKTCRHCKTTFSFEDSEVDTSKSLPHIFCPGCRKSVQLNAKWLNFFKKEKKGW